MPSRAFSSKRHRPDCFLDLMIGPQGLAQNFSGRGFAAGVGQAEIDRDLLCATDGFTNASAAHTRNRLKPVLVYRECPIRHGSRSGRPDPGSHRRRISLASSTSGVASWDRPACRVTVPGIADADQNLVAPRFDCLADIDLDTGERVLVEAAELAVHINGCVQIVLRKHQEKRSSRGRVGHFHPGAIPHAMRKDQVGPQRILVTRNGDRPPDRVVGKLADRLGNRPRLLLIVAADFPVSLQGKRGSFSAGSRLGKLVHRCAG